MYVKVYVLASIKSNDLGRFHLFYYWEVINWRICVSTVIIDVDISQSWKLTNCVAEFAFNL